MSALAVGTADNAIVFAADGVCYDYAEGKVSGLGSKLLLMPEIDCILGWTGLGAFGEHFRLATSMRFADFDALLDEVVGVSREIHLSMTWNWQRLAFNTGRETYLSFVLGGWSNVRQRFESYRIVSYAKESLDGTDPSKKIMLEPWRLLPMPGMWASSAPSPETCARFGTVVGDGNYDMTDMAIRFICANRAESGIRTDPETGAESFYNVGGFVQVAVLQRGNVNSWIAHRWPEDVIGMPIDPTRGKPMP